MEWEYLQTSSSAYSLTFVKLKITLKSIKVELVGLSICKNLIEQMGGSVQVESIIKKFTKFHIRIITLCKIKDLEAIQDLVF
jgi:hypothetical protein